MARDPDDGGDKDDPEKERNGPEVTVNRTGKRVHVSSELTQGGAVDDLDVSLDLKNGLEVKMVLEHSEDRVETRIEATFTFRCLVGIGDKAPSGGIDCNDQERSVLRFSDLVFQEPSVKETKQDGVKIIKIEFNDKEERFFGWMELPANFEGAEDGVMVPSPVSMEVKVKKFEFREEDTRLAMKVKVSTNVGFQKVKGLEGDPDQLEPAGIENEELGSAYMSFAPKANVDSAHDEEVEVISTETDSGTELDFIYPKCYKVFHDVEMGLLPQAVVLKGDAPLYGATIGAMATLFVLTDPRVYGRLLKK